MLQPTDSLNSSDLYNNEYIDTDGNLIHKTAIIGDNVKLGKGNVIMPYCVIGEPGFIRNMTEKRLVFIGNNNKIGCFTTVMSGQEGTFIGDKNLIMNYCNIGHDVVIGNENEIGPGTIISGHVRIYDKVKIKSHCTIRNRLLIESESVIGQGSNVISKVLAGQTVYGNPAGNNKSFKVNG